ncbi:uncharacterized protein [Euphorbia lathyris]|uniref:uncharacterized protein isoform X2 n=1 Tax=Euphorbia lathyris TaxID=212925 RepID=UPI0033131240
MKIIKPSNFNQRTNQFPNSPRMLKDFLTDEFLHSNSSSNVSRSFSTVGSHNDHLNSGGKQLLLTRTRSVSGTISAFNSMFNALKNINFGKSSSRTSRRRRNTICGGDLRQINEPQITIKDIIRWKSFRDFSDHDDDVKSPPLSSEYHCTTTTTTTTTATSSPFNSSSGSSWCGSDFTAENLPCWGGGDGKSAEENEKGGEKCLLRRRRVCEEKAEVGPKKDPISVMEITFEEDWWSSSFDQTVERINLEKRMSTIRKFAITDGNTDFTEEIYQEVEEEEIEEKAMQLLNHVKEESEKRLVMDLFREVTTNRDIDGRLRKEEETVRKVKEWINGEDKLWIGWDKKDAYVREIEREYETKLEEEKEEISVEVQNETVDLLVDELLSHLIISVESEFTECLVNHLSLLKVT